jgi:crotonobetaine/carnitine-CoA ligase
VPDDLRQEEVKAFLVPVDGIAPNAIDLVDVARFAAERLAPFKVPRYWEARPSLPLTPSQRVAKHQLLKDVPPAGWDRSKG